MNPADQNRIVTLARFLRNELPKAREQHAYDCQALATYRAAEAWREKEGVESPTITTCASGQKPVTEQETDKQVVREWGASRDRLKNCRKQWQELRHLALIHLNIDTPLLADGEQNGINPHAEFDAQALGLELRTIERVAMKQGEGQAGNESDVHTMRPSNAAKLTGLDPSWFSRAENKRKFPDLFANRKGKTMIVRSHLYRLIAEGKIPAKSDGRKDRKVSTNPEPLTPHQRRVEELRRKVDSGQPL